ncbi:sortase [Rugosimonospora africana]|uniref:Sortase n=1 Tax=Rugosimonospora africana TaxID=556532 RepID=A0A8J3R2C7_9ACTN|nr:sortase [Rugosimonospora africana]GIH20378.1 sortase [Rugosimonospora africana]
MTVTATRQAPEPDILAPWLAPPAPRPLNRWRDATGIVLHTLAVVVLGFVLTLTLVSWLEHHAAQTSGYNTLRVGLAQGTAPVGQTGADGRLLAPGTPVALLKIPVIHVNEVVFEGTTSGILMSGPGHERDTVLPGQPGTSVIMGRLGAYGGPFRNLERLDVGDVFTVTTGQGVATYQVVASRRAGDAVPPPLAPGKGRLTLVTAAGTPFLPSGLLRVDADLVSPAQPAPRAALPRGAIEPRERPMAGDTSTAWALLQWAEVLLVATVAAAWCWRRWGRRQSWIVFLPVLTLLGLAVADQTTRLLPNLL